MICPSCGRDVQVFANGRLRVHAVPIEQRRGDRYERCPGGGP